MRIRSKAFLAWRLDYLRRTAPALFGPGVTLTPDQKSRIQELLQAGEPEQAQSIILDALEGADTAQGIQSPSPEDTDAA